VLRRKLTQGSTFRLVMNVRETWRKEAAWKT